MELIEKHWEIHNIKYGFALDRKPPNPSGYAIAIICSNFLEGSIPIGDATDEEMAILRTQLPTVRVKL